VRTYRGVIANPSRSKCGPSADQVRTFGTDKAFFLFYNNLVIKNRIASGSKWNELKIIKNKAGKVIYCAGDKDKSAEVLQ